MFSINSTRHTAVLCLSAFCMLAASGCSIGPAYVRGSRSNYNAALQVTSSQEMLLNLVRSRYGEPPEFLAVSGITTQFESDAGFGFGNKDALGPAGFVTNFNATDRPTISLTPLQSEQFTRRFLSPISLETIYLFTRNGRRVDRALRLTVDRINGISNSPDGLESSSMPGAFNWIAQTLDSLAKTQQVELAYQKTSEQLSPSLEASSIDAGTVLSAVEKGYRFESTGEGKSLSLTAKGKELGLRVSPLAVGSPEMEGITELLRLKPGVEFYPLEPAVEGQLKSILALNEELHISTRSVEEILHFVCYGVSVPPKHVEKGLITHQDEASISCSDPPSDLLRVHWSTWRPHHAAVAIRYRGCWFYIDDADSGSKETFELLLELYNLEIRGGGAASLPMLTLPIGR